MSGMLLSCANMPVIKQIADLLGIVMNGIYYVFDKLGFANIGLCIIVFTIFVKLLMIPMTIKQQKTTKLSSLINPEIQAIQKKYQGKRDNESLMKMNAETTAVYNKYGTTPTGGCLPMLLQMCILLALWGVISAIPSHVGDVKDLYESVAESIQESIYEYDDLNQLNQLMVENSIEGFEEQKKYDKIIDAYYDADSENVKSDIYLVLTDTYRRQNEGLDTDEDSWDDMDNLKETSLKVIDSLKNVDESDWKKVKGSELTDDQKKLVEKYAGFASEDYDKLKTEIVNNYDAMEVVHNDIKDIYGFAGIDLSRSPSQEMSQGIWWAILIPIIAALGQWLSTRMSQSTQPSMQDNPMASSMKVMMLMGPLMTAFFGYTLAAGLGIYWAVGAIIQVIQTYFINAYFKKIEVDDIIKSNVEKLNKKRERQGLPAQKITAAANTNVKSIKASTENPGTENKSANVSSGSTYKKGGIAAKANMVKDFNDKNNK